MPIDGEKTAEFMYVKRAFQWEVDDLSYYETLRSVSSTIGTALAMPIFHYFHTPDNAIILVSIVSCVSQRIMKWLAKSGDVRSSFAKIILSKVVLKIFEFDNLFNFA